MPHTCNLNRPRSIPINIEYSKVILYLVNAIAFHLMTSS